MKTDLLIRNVRLSGHDDLQDISIANGTIAAISHGFVCEAIEEYDAKGSFAFPGFTDIHVHLDKACILGRCTICQGTLSEAVAETAKAKAAFTQDDVYARAQSVLRKAITHGTNRMRTFVEVDPRVALRSFQAIKQLKSDYAYAIDLEICAFAQEGLTNEPETFSLLDKALTNGADIVGGCPYTDPSPTEHVRLIFDLAEKHGVDIDFHLDFDLKPEKSSLAIVAAETKRRGYEGRVTIGHMTSLSALTPEALAQSAELIQDAGLALVSLPATDLFLNGRDFNHLVPRGVAPVHNLGNNILSAIATNNVLNPFTPFGDASLIRMANLYANVQQIAADEAISHVFAMVSSQPDLIMRRVRQLISGASADIVLLDCPDPVTALREITPALCGWKNGRKIFERSRATLFEAP